MALTIIKYIEHGERLPFGYGVAWYDDWSRGSPAVAMPVPLNLLARVLRDAWCYLAHPGQVPVNPRSAYLQGKAEGRLALYDDMASMGVQMGRRGDES